AAAQKNEIDAVTGPAKIFDLSEEDKQSPSLLTHRGITFKKEIKEAMFRTWEYVYKEANIRRCSKCLMPETTTFIEFDENGVCNYCRNHEPVEILGREALEEMLKSYRGASAQRNCIFPLSGGRDSCYGMHYIKKELGMNPIAMTYDWGMVTDLARRNQARMCGKLGVEHIVVSADIAKKRRNIRKNMEAWLRKPELGMIPLLMAGDKQMLLYGNRLLEQTGINLLIWCIGNGIEYCPFQIGLSGVFMENFKPHQIIPFKDKMTYLMYYGKQYLRNPSYINISLLDTLHAFLWTFIVPDRVSVHLFKYIPWDETVINDTLINEYDWEISPDTSTTWRIGDGTASFYNYVYLAVLGLTEHDSLRSNQIRQGKLKREDALKMIVEDNKPRYDSIEWYADTIGFDCNKAVEVINKIPKIYK
ncbi:MAG: hypothetical protein GY757_49290, partial [bacterium]|nr:hypothetical protein [bacterium]